MSKVVWKYPLELIYEQLIDLPVDTQILSVQMQNETPTIWALVDSERPKASCRIRIAGTGHELTTADLPDDADFLGTIQFSEGQLVFHIWNTH